mmetsp:Transcript_29280/g.66136  ORF Transcript_29280/g.66136 Transcript_29280/m.66136 type:complete len:88 (-) Transcript_29280:141-404(-)
MAAFIRNTVEAMTTLITATTVEDMAGRRYTETEGAGPTVEAEWITTEADRSTMVLRVVVIEVTETESAGAREVAVLIGAAEVDTNIH